MIILWVCRKCVRERTLPLSINKLCSLFSKVITIRRGWSLPVSGIYSIQIIHSYLEKLLYYLFIFGQNGASSLNRMRSKVCRFTQIHLKLNFNFFRLFFFCRYFVEKKPIWVENSSLVIPGHREVDRSLAQYTGGVVKVQFP